MENIPLNEKEYRLLDLLLKKPPKLQEAREFIKEMALQPENITKAAIGYAEECWLDAEETIFQTTPGEIGLNKAVLSSGVVPGLHSSYICDVMLLLLDYGLQPNAIFETTHGQYNIMSSLLFIDNGHLGADTLALLLENGGDPNLVLDDGTVFEQVDFEIRFGSVEQENRWRYDACVHMWLVLLGYGGTVAENALPVHVFREYGTGKIFDLKRLRSHRDYYYGLSIEEKERTIHIYDKHTFWKVARGWKRYNCRDGRFAMILLYTEPPGIPRRLCLYGAIQYSTSKEKRNAVKAILYRGISAERLPVLHSTHMACQDQISRIFSQ